MNDLTLVEMFERFMNYKRTEALSQRTIEEYYVHFRYLCEYLGRDLLKNEITLDAFRGYISYLLHDKGLSPMTANVRIRTMRAFLRFCFNEGY